MSGAADNAIGNRAAHSEEPVPHETAHAPALAAAGRALHWLLERLAADGEQFWIDRDHSARAALLRILLLQHGVCLEAVETEVERLTLALQRMLADPRGRWLLFGPHHRTWQELDLSQAGAGRSIIDRCFIAADGQPWIIDYKLAAPAAGEPLAAFADRQARLYGPQLERYAALFPGRRPATALYFPLLPYWLELTAGRSHADPATAVDRT